MWLGEGSTGQREQYYQLWEQRGLPLPVDQSWQVLLHSHLRVLIIRTIPHSIVTMHCFSNSISVTLNNEHVILPYTGVLNKRWFSLCVAVQVQSTEYYSIPNTPPDSSLQILHFLIWIFTLWLLFCAKMSLTGPKWGAGSVCQWCEHCTSVTQEDCIRRWSDLFQKVSKLRICLHITSLGV